MKLIAATALLAAAHPAAASLRHRRAAAHAAAAAVGDEICITGYVMDNFCIDNGAFLDAPDLMPLESPGEHSYHCLLDVTPCFTNGYQVLKEDGETYSLGYRIDDTDAVLAAGRALGDKDAGCTTCVGEGTETKGFRATIKGTVSELGMADAANLAGKEGSSTALSVPLLSNVEVLDASVSCDAGEPTTLPEGGEPTTLPEGGEPTTLPEGEPTTLPEGGEPTTLPEGEPTTLPEGGEPTTLPEGEPTTLPEGGEPTTLPEGEPTTLPEGGEPTTLPEGGEPTTLPEGEPTTLPASAGELTTLPAEAFLGALVGAVAAGFAW